MTPAGALIANARWVKQRSQEVVLRTVSTPRLELSTERRLRVGSHRRLRAQRVPMRDGARLAADVYLPDADGPHPTVLIRMPYGKREALCNMPAHGKFWAGQGYACVVQDVRGRWSSEGVYVPFVNEARDGWDTLDWVAAQPWCSGDIGMAGESYFGYTQWAVAHLGHPNLRCIAPGNSAADIYGSWVYVSGAFCLQSMGIWAYCISSRRTVNYFRFDSWHLPLREAAEAAGHPNDTYRDWLDNPRRNRYWEAINTCQRLPDVKVPALHWGGWYDTFLTGTIDSWLGVRGGSQDATVRAGQELVIGATDHMLTPESTGLVGPHRLEQHGYSHDRVAEFMDRHLRHDERGHAAAGEGATAGGQWLAGRQRAPVRYFVIGRNEWRSSPQWPPPAMTPQRFYLHSAGHANSLNGDGRLGTDPPHREPADTYFYDPAKPVTYWLNAYQLEAARHLSDRRPVEQREDVLVYTSESLERDLELSGPITASLHVSTSGHDTDFTVALVDVFEDGHAHLVQEGISRLRYRESDARESEVLPGTVYEINIDVWATSYLVRRGHRLRVEVSSSNFDRYDRNLNTGEPTGCGTKTLVACQTVFHDGSKASFITLPVMPEG